MQAPAYQKSLDTLSISLDTYRALTVFISITGKYKVRPPKPRGVSVTLLRLGEPRLDLSLSRCPAPHGRAAPGQRHRPRHSARGKRLSLKQTLLQRENTESVAKVLQQKLSQH